MRALIKLSWLAVQVVKEHGPQLDETTLAAMLYTSAVIRENLRLHSIVGIVPRITLKDLEVDGFFIPKVLLSATARSSWRSFHVAAYAHPLYCSESCCKLHEFVAGLS